LSVLAVSLEPWLRLYSVCQAKTSNGEDAGPASGSPSQALNALNEQLMLLSLLIFFSRFSIFTFDVAPEAPLFDPLKIFIYW
jgi:hypothetical protein